MRQTTPLEADEKVRSGLEESLWAQELEKLDQELREDLLKPLRRRTVHKMYVREIAYRSQPKDEHPHHVGVFVSPSPAGPIVGFMPMRYIVLDRELQVWPGPKIHFVEELKREREPIEAVVRETGKWGKRHRHLDYVFMMPRPFDAQEVQGRQALIHTSNHRHQAVGLEELTVEQVRSISSMFREKVKESLRQLEILAALLKEAAKSGQEIGTLLNDIEVQVKKITHILSEVTSSKELPLVWETTMQHELGNPLEKLELVDSMEPPFQGDRIEINLEAIRRIQEVISEMASLQYLRVTVDAMSPHLVLSFSGDSLLPRWFDPSEFPARYGKGLLWEKERLNRAILEVGGVDRIMLIPLTPRGGEVITLQPLLAEGVERTEAIDRYLEQANRTLQHLGIQFAEPTSVRSELFQKLGFLISGEVSLPNDSVPEGYPVFQVEQLLQYHPVLVAAKALHPQLSLDFLKSYQVKGLILLEDNIHGARYLGILA